MKKSDRFDLPFDQYTRQEIVRKIVDEHIRPFATKNRADTKLKIVDLGGHKGHTQDFFPYDHVVILDVFDESYDNYVKGDATKTPFTDNEFDIAVSFDTLEHIPQEGRGSFISEAARISEYAFLIAAPFDNAQGDISRAEVIANELYCRINGAEHPWLAEHISYRTPTKQVTEDAIKQTGHSFISTPTNNLFAWLLAQGLMFNATAMSGNIKEVVDVSRFYNQHMRELENLSGETYRQIYTCSMHTDLIQGVKTALQHENRQEDVLSQIEYMGRINEAYAALIDQFKKDTTFLKEREAHLQGKYNEAMEQVLQLQQTNTELKQESETIRSSKAWKLARKLGKSE